MWVCEPALVEQDGEELGLWTRIKVQNCLSLDNFGLNILKVNTRAQPHYRQEDSKDHIKTALYGQDRQYNSKASPSLVLSA